MTNFGHDWDDKEVAHYSTRHLYKVLLKRMKVLSAAHEVSVEYVLNRALDIGLGVLERQRGEM